MVQLEQTPRIDFGAHLYPETPITEDNPDAGLEQMLGKWDADVILDRYKFAGIDRAVLSQPYYMGHGNIASTSKANDALLEIVNRHDEFYGLAAIPVAAGGEVAAEEFERSLKNGYRGGALETKTEGIELVDQEITPIFEVAERHNAPILVHPKLDNSLHPETLDDTYQLNATFGREAALSESICKVIHEGVLDTFPNLDLVFHHLGGNIASMMGRIHLRLDRGRWPNQERTKPFEEFKSLLEERIFLDSSGFFGYDDPVNTTLRQFPATQVLFGTDAPYEPRTEQELEEFVKSIERAASRHDVNKILGGNALELLE